MGATLGINPHQSRQSPILIIEAIRLWKIAIQVLHQVLCAGLIGKAGQRK
jgi:hypothetical protein